MISYAFLKMKMLWIQLDITLNMFQDYSIFGQKYLNIEQGLIS